MSTTSCHFDGNTINITFWKEVLGNAKSKALLSEKRKNATNVFVLPLLPIIIGNDIQKWRSKNASYLRSKKKEKKRNTLEFFWYKNSFICYEHEPMIKKWKGQFLEHWGFPKTLHTLIFHKAFRDQASDITATKSSRPQTYSPSTDLSRSCARSSYDMARVKAGGLSASEARSPFEAVAIRPWQPLK